MNRLFPRTIPKPLQKQAALFYVILFAFSYLLVVLDAALALLFLGAAFILMGPFVIIERNSIPIKNVFVSVSAALVLIFVGGIFWHLSTLV